MLWSASNWGMNYTIEFDIMVANENVNKYVNIFQMTSTGKGCCNIGDRIPSFHLDPKGNLFLCTNINENGNRLGNSLVLNFTTRWQSHKRKIS